MAGLLVQYHPMKERKTDDNSVVNRVQNAVSQHNLRPRKGDCSEIAAAVHDATGDTVVAVIRDDEPEYALHLLNRRPDGTFYDGSGRRSGDGLVDEYGGYDPQTGQTKEARLVNVSRDAVESLSDEWDQRQYEALLGALAH